MRIETTSIRIPELIDRVGAGEFLIPKFQREFVWDSSTIKLFFDSILRGFPVGSLILWTPSEVSFEVETEVGGIKIVGNRKGNGEYVLDGRQRITTLMSVLNPDGDLFDNYYIDLSTDDILYASNGARKSHPRYLKLGVAFDPVLLLDRLDDIKKHPSIREDQKRYYQEKAKEINKILSRYSIGVVGVEGGEIDEATVIFYRLNSQGVDISEDYMIQAMAYGENNNFRFGEEITKILESLQQYNFDGLKRGVIFRCVFNYLDKPVLNGKAKLLLKVKKQLPSIMGEMASDVRRLVEFLYHDLGMVKSELLPNWNQFIFLSYYFRKHREGLNPEQKGELMRWFLYTTYTGRFSNQSLADSREDFQDFMDFADGKKNRPIEYDLSQMNFDAPRKVNLSNVRSKAYIISSILSRQEPVPEICDLELMNLVKGGDNGVGNRVITMTTEERAEFIQEQIKMDEVGFDDIDYAVLSKYGISAGVVEGIMAGQKEEAILRREKVLLEREKSFVMSKFKG